MLCLHDRDEDVQHENGDDVDYDNGQTDEDDNAADDEDQGLALGWGEAAPLDSHWFYTLEN